MDIITINRKPTVENLLEKAVRLLRVIEGRMRELERSPPAARIALICLKYGIPPGSLRRAQLEGATLRIGSRTVSLSEKEAALLKPWVGSPYGLRSVSYYVEKVLKDLGLRAIDVHLLRMIVEGKPPKRIPLRLLKALEQLA